MTVTGKAPAIIKFAMFAGIAWWRIGGMGLAALALLVGGWPGYARAADVLELVNGNRLECRVLRFTEDGVLVTLDDGGHSSLVLPAASIARIEYDFSAKFAALLAARATMAPAEFNRAVYDLAVATEERARLDPALLAEAVNLYAFLVEESDRPGVPLDAWSRLARHYEAAGQAPAALKLWEDVLRRAPGDPAAQAAVERLRKMPDAGPADATDQNAQSAAAAALKGIGQAGLEAQRGWRALDGYNRSSARPAEDDGTGMPVLELETNGEARKGKSIFRLASSRPGGYDMSKNKALVIDRVYVPADVKGGFSLSVALATGARHEWFESPEQRIKPGAWNGPFRFDLTLGQWKSAASGWNHNTKPAALNQVQAINLLLNGDNTGKCYVAGIRMVED